MGVLLLKLRIIGMVFFGILLLYSTVYGQNIELSGKVGGFIFATDTHASSGYLFGGRVSKWLSNRSLLILDTDAVRSSKISYKIVEWYYDWYYTEQTLTMVNIFSIHLIYKWRLLRKGILIPYAGAGIGYSRMQGDYFIKYDKDNSCRHYSGGRNDSAYKFLLGLDITRYLFFEANYLSGGRGGNTGVILSVGFRYLVDR